MGRPMPAIPSEDEQARRDSGRATTLVPLFKDTNLLHQLGDLFLGLSHLCLHQQEFCCQDPLHRATMVLAAHRTMRSVTPAHCCCDSFGPFWVVPDLLQKAQTGYDRPRAFTSMTL